MRQLLSFHKIGNHREHSRIYLEGAVLSPLGFAPGTPVAVEHGHRRVTIRVASAKIGRYTVSSRRVAGGRRPVLDLNHNGVLAPIFDYAEAKVTGTLGTLVITPSIRAFHIRKAFAARPPFGVMEYFCGGGTLSRAFEANPCFKMVGGMEIEPAFADCWQRTHPNSTLIQADLRIVSPQEVPPYTIGAFGIPCSDHAAPGRAKKHLQGHPELGGIGDLYVHVLAHIQYHMPLACLLENVPAFGKSLAGETLKANLRQIGYHVSEMILCPNAEWNEPSDRRRWVCVATLMPGFAIQSPMAPFTGTAADYLDVPEPARDKADATRIATAIAGLKNHHARHSALGHRFGFTVLNGSESLIPTIVKSYHKCNIGPFVATPYGPRMLRQAEIERIHGCPVATDHYTTAVQILGQGVQTRVFTLIASQLSDFLFNASNRTPAQVRKAAQLTLF